MSGQDVSGHAHAQMDGEGWIPTSVIASFNRVRMLTPDLAVILEALRDSPVVETSPDLLNIRARDGWAGWVLPPDARDPSVAAPKVAVAVLSPSGVAAPALLPAPQLPLQQQAQAVARSNSSGRPGSDSGRGDSRGVGRRKPYASAPVTPKSAAPSAAFPPPPISLGLAAARAARSEAGASAGEARSDVSIADVASSHAEAASSSGGDATEAGAASSALEDIMGADAAPVKVLQEPHVPVCMRLRTTWVHVLALGAANRLSGNAISLRCCRSRPAEQAMQLGLRRAGMGRSSLALSRQEGRPRSMRMMPKTMQQLAPQSRCSHFTKPLQVSSWSC